MLCRYGYSFFFLFHYLQGCMCKYEICETLRLLFLTGKEQTNKKQINKHCKTKQITHKQTKHWKKYRFYSNKFLDNTKLEISDYHEPSFLNVYVCIICINKHEFMEKYIFSALYYGCSHKIKHALDERF